MLAPFQIVTKTPDTFNPIDLIDKESPHAIDDCRDLAETLVVTSPNEKDPHWSESAKGVAGAAIMAVTFYGEPGQRSLQTVMTLIANPLKLQGMIDLLCASRCVTASCRGWGTSS